MANNLNPDTTPSDIANLQQRLARLENTPQVGNMSIKAGALQILNASDDVVMSYGYQPDGTVGLVSYDPVTGLKIIEVGQQVDGTQGLAMYNAAGVKVLQLGTTLGDLGLYALSVRNPAGVMQLVTGALGSTALVVQTLTTAGPVAYSDGPFVSAVVGPSGEAECGIGAFIATAAPDAGAISLTVDGVAPVFPATTTPQLNVAGGNNTSSFGTALVTGLTPGLHVFSHTYQLFGAGPAIFSERNIVVQPL